MSDYFYMHPVHVDANNQLYTPREKGFVTIDPMAAYQRYLRAYERSMGSGWPNNSHLDRKGKMFAYWRLDSKMPWRQAAMIARSSAPERVCVLTESSGWWHAEFVLPPGVLIHINVPRETSAGE